MAKDRRRMIRWQFLDKLLSEGEPISTYEIYKQYASSENEYINAKCDPSDTAYNLGLYYGKNLRKDIDIFKKTLAKNGKSDMLVTGRGGSNKINAPDEADMRSRTYCWKEKGFSIIPLLNYEMSDSEYRQLLTLVEKSKSILNELNFEEVKFAIESRIEADYDKGPNCVAYEDNRRLKGRGYRPMLYNAIKNKQILEICHEKFDGSQFTVEIHPYLLKQYNERWFLFGYFPLGDISHFNIPLDRIVSQPVVKGTYPESIPDGYMDYFSNIIGVTHYDKAPEIEIKIGVKEINAWGRLITKPLNTMKITIDFDKGKSYGQVSLKVVPNTELYMKILSLGEHIEIESEPARSEMKKIIQNITKEYGL